MSRILKYFHRADTKLNAWAERFLARHRLAGCLLVFVGMPLLVLAAVLALSAAIIFPISLFF